MTKSNEIIWLPKPENRDYLASLSYLGLIYGKKSAKKLVNALRKAPMMSFKAKNIQIIRLIITGDK